MKRLTNLAIGAAIVVAVLALSSVTLTAQDQPTRLVFVDSQAAISAHPAGQAADLLQEQARQELGELRDDIDVLTQRLRAGEQLTPEEDELYQTLLTTLEMVQSRYQADVVATATPAIEAVNQTIEAVAKENGYTVVLDVNVAARDGLVVYAQDGLDITATVVERIRADTGE